MQLLVLIGKNFDFSYTNKNIFVTSLYTTMKGFRKKLYLGMTWQNQFHLQMIFLKNRHSHVPNTVPLYTPF